MDLAQWAIEDPGLAGAEDKLAQIDRRSSNDPVDLGLPAPRMPSS